jgi:hypothetical protein
MALFYIAHRLFAAHDRGVGAYVASQLAEVAGGDSVFLPFCDTDEEHLVSDLKGRTLFELDCARLRKITGMIALLHGPSLDDGVCMESGFAAALGVPVVLLTTDFQTYTPGPGRDGSVFALLSATSAASTEAATCTTAADCRLAYIEPSPYMADDMWTNITRHLRADGWTVHVAHRFLDRTDTTKAAQVDWTAAAAASLAVVDTRGPETPPGAALITGAFTATGQPVLAAHTGALRTLADGREPNWRNLMIQYAVTARFSDIGEFTAAINAIP